MSRNCQLSGTNMKEAVDGELSAVSLLSDPQKVKLRECYLQQNTVESTAYKLSMDPLIVQMLYYRLSIALSRQAFASIQ
ncbi:MAG: hypothetical protein LKF79_00040 [Solobacterium sp.]|nr:hypothetical protein [Solobacterium sp.]MCH4221792.1 hypothetical protein [Solobacterium sp.]MCH4265014.1 hypothetical protein [Solobacterium sp.]